MTTEHPGPKEAAYDTLIAPLMTQIIAVCKASRINMIAHFALGPEADEAEDGFGQALSCTTCLVTDDGPDEGSAEVLRARRALGQDRHMVMTMITVPRS